MSDNLDSILRNIVKKSQSMSEVESLLIKHKDRRRLFELHMAHVGEVLYGVKAIDLNQPVTSLIKEKYNLEPILAGQSTEGADLLFPVQGGIGIEVKHLDDTNKSLGVNKIAYKDHKLNQTSIAKKVLAVNAHASYKINREYSDWAILRRNDCYDEDIFKEYKQTFKKSKIFKHHKFKVNYRKHKKTKDTKLHKSQIRSIVSHCKKYGRCISRKPTGAGKGADFTLIERELKLDQTDSININVSPSLAILNGNVSTYAGDNHLRLKPKKIYVICSKKELDSEDPILQGILNRYGDIVTSEFEIGEALMHNPNATFFITLHSYYKLAGVMEECQKKCDLLYVDEAKHMVQSEDSTRIAPLYDKHPDLYTIKTKYRVFADANLITSQDKTKINVAMNVTKLWGKLAVDMQEWEAVEAGWKRSTLSWVYLDNMKDIPTKAKKIMKNGKITSIKIGKLQPVPYTWYINVKAWIVMKITNPERRHTLATCNTIDRNIKLCEWAPKAVEEIIDDIVINLYGTTQGYEDLINRIVKTNWIPADTKTYKNTIVSKINKVPTNKNINDSVIVQTKILYEGWSPKDGWIDSVQFFDPCFSHIKIYQTAGRGNRLGRGIDTLLFVIARVVDKDHPLNKTFSDISKVASWTAKGQKAISESVVFVSASGNFTTSVTNGTKKKGNGGGSKNIYFKIQSKDVQKAFEDFVVDNFYHPDTLVVNKIFSDVIKVYNKNPSTNTDLGKLLDKYRKKYKTYLHDKPRNKIVYILNGEHWLLPIADRLKGQQLKVKFYDRWRSRRSDLENTMIGFIESFDPRNENIKNDDIISLGKTKIERQHCRAVWQGCLKKYLKSKKIHFTAQKIKAVVDANKDLCAEADYKISRYSERFFNQVLADYKLQIKKFVQFTDNKMHIISKPISKKYRIRQDKVSMLNQFCKDDFKKIQQDGEKLVKSLYNTAKTKFKKLEDLDNYVCKILETKHKKIAVKFMIVEQIRKKQLNLYGLSGGR